MSKKMQTSEIIDINALVAEYDRLRSEKKVIEDRIKVITVSIKDYSMKQGSKNDKGSYYCSNQDYIFGSQAKKSISFIKDKALDFFKMKGLKNAIKIVESIDEEAVEKYITDGEITYEELESITDTKLSYSIDLKKKEEMPVVEEKTLPLVASKKTSVKPRLKKSK